MTFHVLNYKTNTCYLKIEKYLKSSTNNARTVGNPHVRANDVGAPSITPYTEIRSKLVMGLQLRT